MASADVEANGDAGADLNGDGANDVWVAAPLCDLAQVDQGRVVLLSGKDLAVGDATVIRTIDAPVPQLGARFGSAISVLGDIDGDDVAEIAVGTDSQDVGANMNQGRAWVFSGASGTMLYALDNPAPQADGRFGWRVGRAGDVSGNGRPDVIVGASNNDVSGRANQGQAYIFDGATGALRRALNMPATDQVAGGRFGVSVQGPGDVDGDGVDDQLVGAGHFAGGLSGQGRMYLFSGATGALIRRIDDPIPQVGADFGFQDVAPLGPGDVNGDGRADIYGGARHQDDGPIDAGRAWIFDGRTGATLYTIRDPSPAFDEHFGWSMTTTTYRPTTTSPGVPALYIGKGEGPFGGGADQDGGSYLVKASDGTLLEELSLPACAHQTTSTSNLGPYLGYAVAAPGDLDGDGRVDYVAGAPFMDGSVGKDQGRLAVFRSEGAAQQFRAVYDAETTQATITWNDAADAPFPGSTPGSYASAYNWTLGRGAAAASSGSTDLPYLTMDDSFVGEQVQLTVRAVDPAGNEGPPVSSSLTVVAAPSDSGRPTLSLPDAQARYSASENTTVVDWAPAEDPELCDAAPSAGIESYTVTYRLDGAAPLTTTTELPRLQLPGGRVGQAIRVSVTARDVAGHASTTATADLSAVAWAPAEAGETLACAPTEDGLPPDCNDPDDGNEAAGGPAAQLTPMDSQPTRSATSTGLPRYRIDVEGLWTTARLRPGSYVTGNVRSGWTLDRVGDEGRGYLFGTISTPFQGCGWILSEQLAKPPYANDGTSNCVTNSRTGSQNSRRSPSGSIRGSRTDRRSRSSETRSEGFASARTSGPPPTPSASVTNAERRTRR